MTSRVQTWYVITRACSHEEAVRVAGPRSRRAGVLELLRSDPCAHCAGWPVISVAQHLLDPNTPSDRTSSELTGTTRPLHHYTTTS